MKAQLIHIEKVSYGHYNVTIDVDGNEYTCITKDTQSIDELSDNYDKQTNKNAERSLINGCLYSNDLENLEIDIITMN